MILFCIYIVATHSWFEVSKFTQIAGFTFFPEKEGGWLNRGVLF